ncbi:MAG: hypothetical protein SCK28_12825, partial [Bacillota bacterium]|nr:hypothetical protein [Bacillota bacterium]
MKIFKEASQLLAKGEPFCIVTVIKVGSSYEDLLGQKGIFTHKDLEDNHFVNIVDGKGDITWGQ